VTGRRRRDPERPRGEPPDFEEALLMAMLAHHAGAAAEVVERWRRELADAFSREASGVSR